MNGSPEHPDAPSSSSTPPAAPSQADSAAASPADSVAGSPADSVAASPAAAAGAAARAPAPPAAGSPAAAAAPAAGPPAGAAPVAPAGAAPATSPPPGAPPPLGPPTYAAPPPPPGGQAVPPSMQGAMSRLQRKSPFLAGLLSLMPGIGQIYVGYYAIGFIHIAVFVTIIFLLVRSNSINPFSALSPALGVFLGFFVVYNIVDATRRAVLYNLALDGVEGIRLPDMNASLPNFRLQGSVPAGAGLIALGVVLLSNTLLGFSLDWLASWWPLGLVGLGAYLVAKAREERRAAGPPAGRGES